MIKKTWPFIGNLKNMQATLLKMCILLGAGNIRTHIKILNFYCARVAQKLRGLWVLLCKEKTLKRDEL